MCQTFQAASRPAKRLPEIEKNMREAIEFHIEGMIEDGDPLPEPSSQAIEVEVAVA